MRSRKHPIYGNYSVYSPSGELMFRCGAKKFNWYLSRGLSAKTDENSAKLLFEPKGKGNHHKPHLLKFKLNKCVVCGFDSIKELTRHHVVPYCYRKAMPPEIKNYNHYDILPLCVDCHGQYEQHANKLKQILADKYNAPINGIVSKLDGKEYRAYKYATSLSQYGSLIPNERQEMMRTVISEFLNKKCTDNDIEDLSQKVIELTVLQKTHGEIVMSHIKDIDDFTHMWRQHFIVNMQPKFLPEGWK